MAAEPAGADTVSDDSQREWAGETLQTPVSLELLALVSDWRAQHGLKHEDYTRYRRLVSY